MFAKQQTLLSKHQNELATERRPGASGNAISTPAVTATAPLYPIAHNTAPSLSKPEPAIEASPTTVSSSLIVGPDVKLKGAEILDCDTLVVEGSVEAVMDSRVIRIAQQGAFTGTVGIDIAEIFGEFSGELTARQQLIIHASGRVSGKIRYGSLLVEEGGTLCGDIQSLSNTQSLSHTSNKLEKEANHVMKPHLSTVAG